MTQPDCELKFHGISASPLRRTRHNTRVGPLERSPKVMAEGPTTVIAEVRVCKMEHATVVVDVVTSETSAESLEVLIVMEA